MSLIKLQFLRNNAPYVAGEIAGFDADVCRRFVANGIAVYVEPPPGLDQFGKPLKKADPPKKIATKPKAKSSSAAKSKPKPKGKG